jgi:hypothetical protein
MAMKSTPKFLSRKYYLHRRLRGFCRVNSRRRYISMPEADFNALQGRKKAYVDEITKVYKYMVQYCICES